ncbi:MAG: M14 family zinc carboxypeptidase [Acidobacteriota bacterium]
MSQKKHTITLSLTVLLLAGILVLFSPLHGQKKIQKSPGGYHGELDFSISWKRYYSYAEWTKIMHDIQKQYSHLADIESIGKSRMGRDQYLITITAKSTGPHVDKTAMWVDGAVHGNEVNGITCSLYLIWYLLTRYDYDPYIHDLVDNCTFYILPGLNVDANESYVAHPNIFATFHYHNTGRLIMFQAPPAVRSRNQDPQMQERMQQMREQRLDEMRKTNKYAQVFDRQVAPDDQHDLGEIWIGGTPKKHLRRTPPSRYIEQEAFKNAQFVLYCASQFPRVEIADIAIDPVSDNLLWVEVTVTNDRTYPTSSDRAAKLKRAVELPKGTTNTDPFDSKESFETITPEGAAFRLKGKESKRFCALVHWNGADGWVEISVASKFGGTAKKRITIRKN